MICTCIHFFTHKKIVHIRSADVQPLNNTTEDFIVNVKMSPEEYGHFAQENKIDIKRLFFDKDSGIFFVPVYLTLEEYRKYVKDGTLPNR